jgi:hypothetical protein
MLGERFYFFASSRIPQRDRADAGCLRVVIGSRPHEFVIASR